MPAFKFPNDGKKKIESSVEITDEKYRGRIVDTRYVSEKNLLINIEGSRWIVDYYSQVLNDDNAVGGLVPGKLATYQQARLIKELELKVTSPLSASQETTDKAMIVNGAANMYPCIVPNVGDNFVADIGDGRQGIFQITHSERKTIFKDTAYAVEYQLIDYADSGRYEDMDSKVVQTLHFVRDFMAYGQDPLIEEDEYEQVRSLKREYATIVNAWLRQFSSNEYRCILMPKQELSSYDHFVAKAAQCFFTAADNELMRYNRVLNCSEDPRMQVKTLWDSLTDRTTDYFGDMATKVALTKAQLFARNPVFDGIRFSGINSVVYPIDGALTVDQDYRDREKPIATFIKPEDGYVGNLFKDLNLSGFEAYKPYESPDITAKSLPDIVYCLNDDYYVFSKEFYLQESILKSKLEVETMLYLERKEQNISTLLRIAKKYKGWSHLDKFYQGPVLLVLINAALRGY